MSSFDVVRKIVPSSIKRIIFRLLCNSVSGFLIAKIYKNRIPSKVGRVLVDPKVVELRWISAIFFGLYERVELYMIREYLSGENDVIELGSSIGVTTKAIMARVLPDVTVVAVEANPSLVGLLRENTEEFRNIAIVNKAITDGCRDRIYFSVTGGSLAGTVTNDKLGSIEVEATTLKNLLTDYNVDRFDLVCDIEGAEEIIAEDKDQVLNRCDLIILEMDVKEDHAKIKIKGQFSVYGFDVIYEWGNCSVWKRRR